MAVWGVFDTLKRPAKAGRLLLVFSGKLVFLLGGNTAADVALRFVQLQHVSDLGIETVIALRKSLG